MAIWKAQPYRPHLLMLACSTLAFAQGAFAQTEGAADTRAAQDSGGVADIIVTAQRFSESAQKASVVISVIDADELKGVSDVRQLTSLSPGVQIGLGGGLTQTFVRGVGSFNVLTGQEAAIAYNVDGVYLFSATMVTPLMYDLERIEILKGPQGTLYGRNASGGAVNLITTGAKLGKTEGYIEGEAGNYSRWRTAGAVNLPLGDSFAIRFAGQHVEHEGYLSDGTDDQDLTAGRIRARWEASPDITLQLGFDVSHQGGRGVGTSLQPNPTDDKWIGGTDPRANTGATALFTSQNDTTFLKNNQWSVDAQLDVNLGFATLTVLPAYRHVDARYTDYGPGFGDNQQFTTNEKTIEVRLANRSDRLKWVLGAYYFKNKNDGSSDVNQNLRGSHNVADQKFDVESYAFFGEATYSVWDSFRLIGGLRYTHEKTVLTGRNNGVLAGTNQLAFNPFDPVTNPTGDPADFFVNGGASGSAVTWKAGAELDLSPSSMLFATASRGFKGGGAYANNPGLDNTYDPEYLTAFELGSRNRFFDNRLQLNAEVFYWKLKDQQQTFLANNSQNRPTLTTVNAGKAHMYGGTIDLVWRPTSNDTLRGGVEYTKSKYDSFSRSIPVLALVNSTICDVTPPNPASPLPPPLRPVTIDCSGLPVVRAPKWSASAGYEHRFDLANGAGVIFNGDMTYTSGRFLTINYVYNSYQEANTLFNASLAYETGNKALTVTGWIRNIGNSRVMQGSVEFVPAYSRPSLMAPRTYGASLRYAF